MGREADHFRSGPPKANTQPPEAGDWFACDAAGCDES